MLLNESGLLDFTVSKDGVRILDKDLISRQRSILGFVLKQIGMNIFSGKSIMSISFPIGVFQGQSMLQRIAKSLVYAPYFLETACAPPSGLSAIQLSVH